jgi:hypothetical protein
LPSVIVGDVHKGCLSLPRACEKTIAFTMLKVAMSAALRKSRRCLREEFRENNIKRE